MYVSSEMWIANLWIHQMKKVKHWREAQFSQCLLWLNIEFFIFYRIVLIWPLGLPFDLSETFKQVSEETFRRK